MHRPIRSTIVPSAPKALHGFRACKEGRDPRRADPRLSTGQRL
jgi:hypothetical protein